MSAAAREAFSMPARTQGNRQRPRGGKYFQIATLRGHAPLHCLSAVSEYPVLHALHWSNCVRLVGTATVPFPHTPPKAAGVRARDGSERNGRGYMRS